MAEYKTNKLIDFMDKHMMACEEAGYLISKSIDSKLSFKQKMGLKFHLLFCHLCRKYEKQINQLQYLVNRYKISTENDCPHHLDELKKKSIGAAIREEIEHNS